MYKAVSEHYRRTDEHIYNSTQEGKLVVIFNITNYIWFQVFSAVSDIQHHRVQTDVKHFCVEIVSSQNPMMPF